ncbi:lysine-specific demethylase 8-like [Amphiura filiformis]|uniref:lysine-specific demethylase 8-like n=1 Tax=Amphiura filiformis TaxID=82378 RepID=UPI003B2170B2
MDAKRVFLDFAFPKSKSDFELDSFDIDSSITRQAVHLLHECTDSYFQSRFTFAKDVSDELLHYTWEKLNTGNWKDVSIAWRKVYSYASLIKAASICGLLAECLDDKHTYMEWQVIRTRDKVALEACDMGLLMGAPVLNNILSRLASALQTACTTSLCEPIQCQSSTKTEGRTRDNIDLPASKKQKIYQRPSVDPALVIPRLVCPALLQFKSHYMDKKQPVIIQGAMDHWPARTHRKWSLDYLKQIAGSRTVPIEIGSKYTDENWSQALMTLTDFINQFMADEQNTRSNTKVYLAQHQLFDQIPELKEDICIPDYCCLRDTANRKQDCVAKHLYKHAQYVDESDAEVDDHGDEETKEEDEDVDINAWFGPGGTISPLHHDPKHNCLAQVVGDKYIRLYSEEMTEFVYPHEGYLLNNTSQVNVEDPDDGKFPLFQEARYHECILKPGEMLYIPPKCWHYVRSLTTSFSVSFWWR